MIEEGLRLLVRERQEAEIDASLDAYYGALTEAERAEERAMVQAFQRSRRKLDLEAEGTRSRRRRNR